MQDIINTNSIKTIKFFFNILFDIENMANFYAMCSSSFLACHYSEKYRNLIIKDNINQLLCNSIPCLISYLILEFVSYQLHDVYTN